MIEAVAAVMMAALIAYALTGGADFGGGFWDLVARGPRAPAQRQLIAHAIGPIWEANHVWLIFVIVLCFSAFPRAFAVAGVTLSVPITAALVGIVLRGSAFVFRAYGLEPPTRQRAWGRLFAAASLLTPLALGAAVAGLSSGQLDPARPDPLAGWATPFGLAVAVFTLALFALLAAVYLCAEATDPELREDFRARAIAAEIVAGGLAALTFVTASADAPALYAGLARSAWSWPVQLATAGAALSTVVLLIERRARAARVTAAFQVALVLIGWGLAMDGHLLLGRVRMDQAGTRPEMLGALLAAVGAGALLLAPSLYLLFRVFKGARRG